MRRETLPNQKIVKNEKKDKYEGNFMIMGLNELAIACKELNGTELKVWFYFMKNQPKVEWVLFMVDCTNFTGISSKSYYDAINSLIKKGYIVHLHGNKYAVYDIPISTVSKENILEESSSIGGITPEETTRQLYGDNYEEIPEETYRENNTNNTTNEQYNNNANADDASLDYSATAFGYIVNEQTDTWLRYILSIPEINMLPEEDQGYNKGFYKETAYEIDKAVVKKLKDTKKDGKVVSNIEVFTEPIDYALVLLHLVQDRNKLEQKKSNGEQNALSYHISMVMNQLKSGNLKKERDVLKYHQFYDCFRNC